MCWGAEDSKQWMNYTVIINDGAVAGRSLAVFILENEGSIEKKKTFDTSSVKTLRELSSLKFVS